MGCERPDTFSDVVGERPQQGSVRSDLPRRESIATTNQLPPVSANMVAAIQQIHRAEVPNHVKGALGEAIAETLALQIAQVLRGEEIARAGVNPGPNGVDLLIETKSGHVIAVEVKTHKDFSAGTVCQALSSSRNGYRQGSVAWNVDAANDALENAAASTFRDIAETAFADGSGTVAVLGLNAAGVATLVGGAREVGFDGGVKLT